MQGLPMQGLRGCSKKTPSTPPLVICCSPCSSCRSPPANKRAQPLPGSCGQSSLWLLILTISLSRARARARARAHAGLRAHSRALFLSCALSLALSPSLSLSLAPVLSLSLSRSFSICLSLPPSLPLPLLSPLSHTHRHQGPPIRKGNAVARRCTLVLNRYTPRV